MMKDGGMQMTAEQAKSELMQIYSVLSEEKKKAIDVGIDAIQKIQKIEYIINSPVSIQEDVFRYKMICEVIKE
jgi:ribulose bisphosphate carboxylase small subunit